MSEQPVTFPAQPPSLATREAIELFNAGIAWLAAVGFPPPPQQMPGYGITLPPTDQPERSILNR